MSRIGIFGGRFDPPHLGHINAVTCFQQALSLDKVIVIPTGTSPHKATTCCSATKAERLQMTKLAFEHLDYVEVSSIEIENDDISYTVNTLKAIRESYPQEELFLLMGSDMFLSFQDWYEPQQISDIATLCVTKRKAMNDLHLTNQSLNLKNRFNTKSICVDIDILPYSSTSVRAMIAFKCGAKYVKDSVYSFIFEKGLYYCRDNLTNLPYEELKKVSLSLHNPNRVRHVEGCSDTCRKLAEKYGENPDLASRAGILHDITKALNDEEQLHLCKEYGIILSQFEENNPKLLHAKTGATIAREIFGECPTVCDGICWHTTGKSNMNTFEKIVYVADYMEPNRVLDGVEKLREYAESDLDAATLLGLEMSFEYLNSKSSEIDPNSKGAYLSLKKGN